MSVGNSFSVDTMEHVAGIALSLGVECIKLGNLYVGGCSFWVTVSISHNACKDKPFLSPVRKKRSTRCEGLHPPAVFFAFLR